MKMTLFEPQVDANRYHPNFRRALAADAGPARDVLTDWADGFEDRDGKFVKEFQTTFNSSFWELYLFAILKQHKLRVDFHKDRPDFCISQMVGESEVPFFSMEATTAGNAAGSSPEWEHSDMAGKARGFEADEFNRKAIIRLANSFVAKSRKFEREYSRLEHVAGRPFVLAIAPFDNQISHLQIDRAIRALLYDHYVDERAYFEAPEKYRRPPVRPLSYVRKDNAAKIALGLFRNAEFSHISAVIHSNIATWGKVLGLSRDLTASRIFYTARWNPYGPQPYMAATLPANYEESLCDGLRVYHNPFAEHPLSLDVFRDEDIVQFFFEDGEPVKAAREGHLDWRFVMAIRTT